MLFVENNNTDPYCNHALEEWLMENHNDDCFMLWRNQKAVLLGKNQNAYNEVNLPYAESQGVKIVRRITGGGAVYTDDGTLMFTFINCTGRGFSDFRLFTGPVLAAMKALGIPAEFSGRNDLTVKGGKFSGNAQCTYQGKLLHHGTLMYQTDIEEMAKVLQVNPLKLKDKGVASVQRRVTNLCEYMDRPMTPEHFRQYLLSYVMKLHHVSGLFQLTERDWAQVRRKAAEKHTVPAWIYGRKPTYNFQREAKLPGGMIQIYLGITEGRIEKAAIYGDFFNHKNVNEIEKALIGTGFDREVIRNTLLPLSVEEYFSNISLDEFVNILT